MVIRNFRNCRGAAAVEFAIVCSVLFLILFGIIDFGWYFWHKLVVTNAVREGGRMAILNCEDPYQVTEAEVTDAIRRKLYEGALGSKAEVATIVVGSMDCGEAVTVDVTVPFQFFVLPKFAGVIDIDSVTSSAVMIHEP